MVNIINERSVEAAQTKPDGFPSYVADSIPSILMIVFQFAVAKGW